VTTEVVGNCGFSPFPVARESADECTSLLGIVMGDGATTFPGFDDYAAAVSEAGPASNVAPLVGHGTLRASVIGNEQRRATERELEQMASALGRAMSVGAFGLSSGLCYPPATYAPPDELRRLADVLRLTGGVYSTHVRNETDLVVDSIDEALDTVRGIDVPLHISHLKVAGRSQWGESEALLRRLDAARDSGVDVTVDVYPYTAASTMLHSLLPPWIADGGVGDLIDRLGDPAVRRRVASDLSTGVPGWQNLGQAAGWDRVVVASAGGRPEWEGRSIVDLATSDDVTVADTLSRVLTACSGRVVVVIEAMDDEDMVRFLGWRHAVVGSDGLPLPGTPHPRLTGTFPRVLGRYRHLFDGLEDAVHRMSGASAARFGISGRGLVHDGFVADLVVFDAVATTDQSTYRDPWARPSGIRHVLLAGRAVVWEGAVIDGHAGSVLRRRRV
jgi:N-acyl-D-aspartate/D-glutamate deacylase